jgi:hypothetical protein
MIYFVICAVALVASALTFFSGFGLGTLLLPAFAFFFPVEQAIAMTAVVHFANGLFKVLLVGRRADWQLVRRFGLPAIVAAFVGAWTLGLLTDLPPWVEYEFFGRTFAITPVKVAIGVLLIAFTLWEAAPQTREKTFSVKWLPLGGALSGFFGGLSGNQGALRSAFLVKAGSGKEVFIGTGAVIACAIDLTRLGTYSTRMWSVRHEIDYGLLAVGVFAAFVGAWWGNRALRKVTMDAVQRLVTVTVLLVGIGLMAGAL